MSEPGESAVDAAAVAGRGLGLVALSVLTRKVLAQGLSYLHDWSYLLGRLGLLRSAETFGRLIFALGALTMFLALLLLGLDTWQRWHAPPRSAEAA